MATEDGEQTGLNARERSEPTRECPPLRRAGRARAWRRRGEWIELLHRRRVRCCPAGRQAFRRAAFQRRQRASCRSRRAPPAAAAATLVIAVAGDSAGPWRRDRRKHARRRRSHRRRLAFQARDAAAERRWERYSRRTILACGPSMIRTRAPIPSGSAILLRDRQHDRHWAFLTIYSNPSVSPAAWLTTCCRPRRRRRCRPSAPNARHRPAAAHLGSDNAAGGGAGRRAHVRRSALICTARTRRPPRPGRPYWPAAPRCWRRCRASRSARSQPTGQRPRRPPGPPTSGYPGLRVGFCQACGTRRYRLMWTRLHESPIMAARSMDRTRLWQPCENTGPEPPKLPIDLSHPVISRLERRAGEQNSPGNA